MKKRSVMRSLGVMTVVLIFLSPYIFFKNTYRMSPAQKPVHPQALPYSEISRPRQSGERVVYEIYLGKVPLGRAVFTDLPDVSLGGRTSTVVSFETRLARFYDREKIYSDPATYLPLRIERFVTTWPTAETIIEEYDQNKFSVTITKKKGAKEERMVIKKNDVINNAIILPFFIRSTARLDIGYNFVARLPTREYTIRLVSKEEVEVPAGRFVAYKFESTPRQFEIWISDDQYRIPLKIKGSSGLGYTLAMREYHRPSSTK